jgi:hypothetical protein
MIWCSTNDDLFGWTEPLVHAIASRRARHAETESTYSREGAVERESEFFETREREKKKEYKVRLR